MFALPRRRLLASAILGMLAVLSALPSVAQNYPARPITLIVPWGAGGGTDATARIIGSLLEKDLGQPVTVVNRTGGSGVVGPLWNQVLPTTVLWQVLGFRPWFLAYLATPSLPL
jgi:tripartite-type tricarboxylate transporter receptor subunit TctC